MGPCGIAVPSAAPQDSDTLMHVPLRLGRFSNQAVTGLTITDDLLSYGSREVWYHCVCTQNHFKICAQ